MKPDLLELRNVRRENHTCHMHSLNDLFLGTQPGPGWYAGVLGVDYDVKTDLSQYECLITNESKNGARASSLSFREYLLYTFL
jgi:hypothetical protein